MGTDTAIKILLVDDNENNLMSMEVVLEKEGYSFSKAASGREALRILLKEEDFSLILLDVKMPIMDGYETAELIYQRDKLKDIPIIFITAHDYEEAAMFKGYKAGAVDFVRKPFNPDILRSKVAIFAELHKKNRLLMQQEEKLQAINNDLVKLNLELEQRVLERTTELENVNEELRALNESKDKFLSVISHDLRNPLTSLLVSSENLMRDAEKLRPEQIKMFSGIIHKTSKKILNQLNELVEWAKTQREKIDLKRERIHLFEGINDALELLKENAVQKSIALENNIEHGLYVNADLYMLRSVLQNLVTNAIKFTPPGGSSVKVTATPVEDMVEICVQDAGVGMSKETMSKLFNRSGFPTVLGTSQERGTGLGLMLVKDFVVQHGGTISVESEVGQGTCFKFTMPTE
ncbi:MULTISPECIES: hybrid sensor histidine kinase/response regulator [unclassified Mucilaginibacter]|uniref:hybrid sensor histidine kinase/response regulator n=1 Tax=unclassified Mucilaginibacter TaxID=2617802 RepID=UPI0031F65631